MNVQSVLKKEGINVISKLNTFETNKIASNISLKICNAFPEHNFNQSDLFRVIARLDMYIAEMTDKNSVAKYFYKDNSIYFSKNINFNDVHTLALHECIHFIQTVKSDDNKLLRLGLYTPKVLSNAGIALNEAAVQLMSSIANKSPIDSVKYYNLDFQTESPDYYPIQTALLKEMIYFTGSYPLFHSTFNSNDIFKNTFIEKSNAADYKKIESNFDLIMFYEAKLAETFYELSGYTESTKSLNYIKKLNEKSNLLKKIICEKTLETQNIILTSCFEKEFQNITSIESAQNFKDELYNFKDVLISTDGYNFFNDYYRTMMIKYSIRVDELKNQSSDTFSTTELTIVNEHTYGFKFFKSLFGKLKLLLQEILRAKDF